MKLRRNGQQAIQPIGALDGAPGATGQAFYIVPKARQGMVD